jgi:hypothetical protein
MNEQEKIARIAEIKALLATATKEDKVTLAAELTQLNAELAAEQAAKNALVLPTNVDIDSLTSQAIYDLLQPHFSKGKVIAIVEDCRDGSSDRTNTVNTYRVKLAIPSQSAKDVFGVARGILQGYWIVSNSELTIGQVVTIDLKGFVITIDNKLLDDNETIAHPKSIVRIETIFDLDKKQLLSDRYALAKQKTTIQGVELFTFIDTRKVIAVIDAE